ncbi:MAG TPA: HEAT repeat domain-containing protein [Bacteroidia bacterium]|nr:HEAT repeat domain-containing protein [Bacteroidia bacterium]
MGVEEIVNDKSLKGKSKVETLSQYLMDGSISIEQIILFAEKQKDPAKATCVEALEFATKVSPQIGTKAVLDFAAQSLASKAPRVKWESAKVIGNIAHLFPNDLNKSIDHLLTNTEHDGIVVRWSAAFALGEILKMKTKHNKLLLPAIEAICDKEEKKSIKKIYIAAIKKSK